MRLLPEKEKYFESVKKVVEKINEETKDLKPHCVLEATMDDSKDEKSGVLQFVFAVKNTESKSEKKYSVGMFMFENKKGIVTFIINGRTLKCLFENSTINSPEIALHYLNDILLNEIKWVAKLEGKLSSRKKPVNKKNFQKRSGNFSKNKQGERNNRYGSNSNQKSGHGQKNQNSGYKKNYGNQGRNNKRGYTEQKNYDGRKDNKGYHSSDVNKQKYGYPKITTTHDSYKY